MSIIRILANRHRDYTVIPNEILRDTRLSWKAKGLFSYFMSRPPDWTVRMGQLVSVSRDGRDAVRTAISELKDVGYLRIEQKVTGDHKFASVTYHLYDRPADNPHYPSVGLADLPAAENPSTENPSAAFPSAENPPLPNTDLPISGNESRIESHQSLPQEADNMLFSASELPQEQDQSEKVLAFDAGDLPEVRLGKLLLATVREKRNIRVDGHKLRGTVGAIERLHRLDGIDWDRLEKAIVWYVQNWDKKFVPEIESGVTLRQKWIRLEAAITKSQRRRETSTEKALADLQALAGNP